MSSKDVNKSNTSKLKKGSSNAMDMVCIIPTEYKITIW